MLRRKIATAFVFLFLFAFAGVQVETVAHGILHRHDPHCSAAEKHFHEQEHHCFACDMNVQLADVDQPQPFSVTLPAKQNAQLVFSPAEIIPQSVAHPAQRGPPIFS
jgi:hypothetical protein